MASTSIEETIQLVENEGKGEEELRLEAILEKIISSPTINTKFANEIQKTLDIEISRILPPGSDFFSSLHEKDFNSNIPGWAQSSDTKPYNIPVLSLEDETTNNSNESKDPVSISKSIGALNEVQTSLEWDENDPINQSNSVEESLMLPHKTELPLSITAPWLEGSESENEEYKAEEEEFLLEDSDEDVVFDLAQVEKEAISLLHADHELANDRWSDEHDDGFDAIQITEEDFAARESVHSRSARERRNSKIEVKENKQQKAELERKKSRWLQKKQLLRRRARRREQMQRMHASFALRIVHQPYRTGFEPTKDLELPLETIVAERFQVIALLGSAAFSSAYHCLDLFSGDEVCLKVIKNTKDYFDQSLDEIKLLKFINSRGDADGCHILRLVDYFYYREHLILVTELLRDNLYELSRYVIENNQDPYFTLSRIQRITRQVLEALVFIHNLDIIHCDLKPENILIKSYSRCLVKIIDFGSSCFTTDHLSTYIQSRTYRAPEVILGLKYDTKIDVWSVGCIVAEMWTSNVLLENDSVAGMLARISAILGDFPEYMVSNGVESPRYFTSDHIVYEKTEDGLISLMYPKKTCLMRRIKCPEDPLFVHFISTLLQIDPKKRPTASEALQHPWMLRHIQSGYDQWNPPPE